MSQTRRKNEQPASIKLQTKLILFATFITSLFFPWLLSLGGLFLSLWIIVPAPTFSLLPLGVGAPEISPWLVGVNAIAILLISLKFPQNTGYIILLACSVIALFLSLLPLLQFPATNTQIAAQMETVLGKDYLANIPATLKTQLRSQPFILKDAFRGIAIAQIRIQRGIPFAKLDGVTLKLNLYQPLAVGKYPALVIIYGGAWQMGSPNQHEAFSRYMAAQGYCVIAIDYRHAPQYQFPVQLQDVQTALSYIQTHADALEIDPQRIALMGRSAGAHLATLAANQPDIIPVKAVINYYGPSNLIEGYNDPPFPDPINTRAVLRTFLGGTPEELRVAYEQASPFYQVKGNFPPSLLIYGRRDHLVQAKFGYQLYQQLQSTGNQVIWLEIPWAEHSFDAIFNGVSNQLALYYTERFLAWALFKVD